MPRMFVGIPVPNEYHAKVEALSKRLAGRLASRVRWTKPENVHVTLKFLGDVSDARLSEVKAALASVESPTIYMRGGGCFAFPNMKRPRTLWVGVTEGARACGELAGAIAQVVAPLGFEKDDRPFKCHLTLGRLKKLAKDDWEAVLGEAREIWPGFKVDHFTLWQSELTSNGPIYTVIEEFPLKSE